MFCNHQNTLNKGDCNLGPTLPTPLPSKEGKSFPTYSSTSSQWESDVSVGVLFKDLFINMTSIDQLEHEEIIETFDAKPWAQQLDL